MNMFLGNNGEGKTNILEGISYFCLSKSFYAISDSVALKIGESHFTITGKILSDNGVEHEVQIAYDRALNQKAVSVNKTQIEKASTLIGQFPMVLLSPEHNAITFGSPVERRRFVDFVVAQSSRIYLETLLEYRRILKQRNKVLSTMQTTRAENIDILEPWSEKLVQTGASVMRKRREFIEDFRDIIVEAYTSLSGTGERPGIEYAPSFECAESTTETSFREELQKMFFQERNIGYTLIGPHRDEFTFHVNDRSVKNYASQGQHKTFLIALKMAEFTYLKSRCNETPVLLLDDVLSELDNNRSQKLLDAATKTGQVFITSTHEQDFHELSESLSVPRKFFIRQGNVERVEDTVRIH
jgi:DNA replication and repair protein RecF